ncbi:cytochrome c-550 PedF [Rhodovulum sp. DZ06]|uniref:cytochrome c-550 PedF n=1 Tax=Rhodovulum sp. DZ06 TaxID=3425126 RepID=UPI003D32C41E
MTKIAAARPLLAIALAAAAAGAAFAHGDVAPQPVETGNLPAVGDEWLTENPYRAEAAGEEVWAEAVTIGASGYNQNCARCHGLEVISGGLAPDLRYLEAEEYGDEWYVERFRHGYTQNGITKMPAFGELLGQEAAWAIRTYIETRPDDGALDEYAEHLKDVRDGLVKHAEEIAAGTAKAADFSEELAALKAELEGIAEQVPTASGAPKADSAASRAAAALDGSEQAIKHAAEILTVGLSAAE